jgi:hypothetical protein
MESSQLHHIIGVILRDIAQARVTSDLFSREISKYYEQDGLLRLFPVPRSEIRNVELNLRFIIDKIEVDKDRQDESSAKISGALAHYSQIIADGIVKNLYSDDWSDVYNDKIKSTESGFKTRLKNEILDYLEGKKAKQGREFKITVDIFWEGVEEADEAEGNGGIKEIVGNIIAEINDDVDSEQKQRLIEGYANAIRLVVTERLNELSDEVEYLTVAEEFKVLVDVSKDTLDSVTTDAAISSIHMTSAIRNYTWMQIGEGDDVDYKLTAE